MARQSPQSKSFEPRSRQAWREWLSENHARSSGVWLVIQKKGSRRSGVAYEEAVEEALCFGWIDSLMHSLDQERFEQMFTPRKPKSIWSKSNKARVERLEAQGLIAEAGLAKIEAAKRDGSWTRHDAVEALEVPSDLEKALAANAAARRNFAGFSASQQRMILSWLESAKRPETRVKRIRLVVEAAAENRRPFEPPKA